MNENEQWTPEVSVAVLPPLPPPPPAFVTITLDLQSANVLKQLTGSVIGGGKARQVTDAIYAALRDHVGSARGRTFFKEDIQTNE